jgi:predicted Zn-dependent peptidase
VIVGDFENADARKLVEKYFAGIKSANVPPEPDLTEPRQEKQKIVIKKDPLAPRPAIAIGYQMPERNTPEYYAMGLLEQMLIEGDDSLLRQELVQKRGLTDSIEGGINMLGNMFNYTGPMLLAADVTYDPTTKPETVIEAIDTVIEPLRAKPIDQKTLDRARVKLRSSLYDTMGEFGGFGLMDLLASFALFDDNPARVNDLVNQFNKVTPELVQKTAQEYLRPTNRTIIELQPAPKDAAAPAKNQ